MKKYLLQLKILKVAIPAEYSRGLPQHDFVNAQPGI